MDKAASSQDAALAEPDAQARKGVADALAQLSQGKTTDPAALARAEVLGRIIRAGDRMQGQRQYASGPSEKMVTSSTQDVLNKLASSGPAKVTSISGSPVYLLLALAKGQATAPGRKVVLYFSTGFEVPNLLDDVFKATMSEANRARVAFYAVNVLGLDTTRQGESARAAIEEVAAASREHAQRMSEGGATNTSDATLADRTEESTRADPLQPLKDLAASTGGLAILNTNDFKKAMARVASDVTGYYELAYVPQVQEYDGTFRKIEIKVTRGGTKVQAGNGYLATPPDDAGPILAYELPLLEALKAAEPRRDFEIAAGTFHFGSGAEGREVTLIAEVPASRFKFTADEKNKLYRMHFALLALVKDQEGKVVERVSQDYPFQGPLDKMAAVQQGNVVFKRRLVLPPGRYAVDVVAQDRDAGSTSVHRMPLEVPTAGEGIALSSVVIVRRVEPAAALKAGAPVDAFQVETARIVPSLDDPISKAQTPKISVYLIAYPATAAGSPIMTIEFTTQGKAEGRAQAPLPAPEPDGRIRYLGTFPIDKFELGRHELKVTIRQGGAEAQERLAFTLQP